MKSGDVTISSDQHDAIHDIGLTISFFFEQNEIEDKLYMKSVFWEFLKEKNVIFMIFSFWMKDNTQFPCIMNERIKSFSVLELRFVTLGNQAWDLHGSM